MEKENGQKELINSNEYIGYYIYEDKSIQQLTKRFSISYSKNGIHIVSREEKRWYPLMK